MMEEMNQHRWHKKNVKEDYVDEADGVTQEFDSKIQNTVMHIEMTDLFIGDEGGRMMIR